MPEWGVGTEWVLSWGGWARAGSVPGPGFSLSHLWRDLTILPVQGRDGYRGLQPGWAAKVESEAGMPGEAQEESPRNQEMAWRGAWVA